MMTTAWHTVVSGGAQCLQFLHATSASLAASCFAVVAIMLLPASDGHGILIMMMSPLCNTTCNHNNNNNNNW